MKVADTINPTNLEAPMWKLSYKEEYDWIYDCLAYYILSEDEYKKYKAFGIKAIPMMCILIFKSKDSFSDTTKCHREIFGNQDPAYYHRIDKYSSVLPQN